MDRALLNRLVKGMEIENTSLISVPTYLALDPSVVEQNTKNITQWVKSSFEIEEPNIKVFTIGATPKSQVLKFIINNQKTFVYKHFSISSHFFKESFALNLFQKEDFVPKVIHSDEQFLFLILEYIPYDPQLKYEDYLDRISYNLGRLHSYSFSHAELLHELFPGNSVGEFTKKLDKKIAGPIDKSMFLKAMELVFDLYGDTFCPIILGEFQPHHVLLTGPKCIFVDLDLFTVGFPEYFDLFGFFVFKKEFYQLEKETWKELLAKYLAGKYQREISEKEIDSNYEILSLMTRSLGGPHSMIPSDIFKLGGYTGFNFV